MQRLSPLSTTIVLIAPSERRRTVLAQQLDVLGYSVIALDDLQRLGEIQRITRFDLVIVDLHDQPGSTLADQVSTMLVQGTPVLTLSAEQPRDAAAWTQDILGARVLAALRSQPQGDMLAAREQQWSGLGVLEPQSLLFSRRYFDVIFPIEIERAHRAHQPLAVLLVDLAANRPLDALWRSVSTSLITSLRQTDAIVRFEPETVLVLLPATEAPLARIVAARLQRAIGQLRRHDDSAAEAAVGIAAYPAHGTTPETVLRAAETALTHAAVAGSIVSVDQF